MTDRTPQLARELYDRCASQALIAALQRDLDARYESSGWTRVEPYGRYKDSGFSVSFALDLTPACGLTRSLRHAALVGPTAAGKSALALDLARRDASWELVSVDSMQVYRGMDIGTAKPTAAERAEVIHHLLDLLDPSEESSVAWFQQEARRAIAGIEERGKRALLVGGTGLYHRAVIDDLAIPGEYRVIRAELEAEPDTRSLHRRVVELDPLAASRMEPTNRRRVIRALEVTLGSGKPFSSYGPGLRAYPPTRFALIGLDVPPDDLRGRIAVRYAQQLAAGFLDEVRRLRNHPGGLSRTAAQALGYRELLAHLDGAMGLEEAVEVAVRRTRRFARRQRVWFRRDPRVTWIDAASALDEICAR